MAATGNFLFRSIFDKIKPIWSRFYFVLAKQEIEALLEQMKQSAPQKITDFYAEHAVFMPPGGNALTGKQGTLYFDSKIRFF